MIENHTEIADSVLTPMARDSPWTEGFKYFLHVRSLSFLLESSRGTAGALSVVKVLAAEHMEHAFAPLDKVLYPSTIFLTLPIYRPHLIFRALWTSTNASLNSIYLGVWYHCCHL